MFQHTVFKAKPWPDWSLWEACHEGHCRWGWELSLKKSDVSPAVPQKLSSLLWKTHLTLMAYSACKSVIRQQIFATHIKNRMSSLLMCVQVCVLVWSEKQTVTGSGVPRTWHAEGWSKGHPLLQLLAHTDLLLNSNCLKTQLKDKHVNNISNLNTSRVVVLSLWTAKLWGTGVCFQRVSEM